MLSSKYVVRSAKERADDMTTTTERLTVVTPANRVPGPGQGNWTYDDYAALPDDGQRYEIVDGVLYMAPSPSGSHQDVVGWLFHYLLTHVRIAGLGRVYIAPFDIELAPGQVVQPDVTVVLNANCEKIKPSRIIGAPDLVVEVSSPSTVGFDRRQKQDAYARSGVTEYWIADPIAQTIEVFFLVGGAYQSQGIFIGNTTLVSQVVPTISEIRVEKFFV